MRMILVHVERYCMRRGVNRGVPFCLVWAVCQTRRDGHADLHPARRARMGPRTGFVASCEIALASFLGQDGGTWPANSDRSDLIRARLRGARTARSTSIWYMIVEKHLSGLYKPVWP